MFRREKEQKSLKRCPSGHLRDQCGKQRNGSLWVEKVGKKSGERKVETERTAREDDSYRLCPLNLRMSKSGMDIVKAAGGLLWRETKRGVKLALVHRPKYDDWSLPKGKLLKGERWQDAAEREVHEETKCQFRRGDFAGISYYPIEKNYKLVLFWNMTLVGECQFEPNDEIDRLVWLTVPEALDKMDYKEERALVRSNSIQK